VVLCGVVFVVWFRDYLVSFGERMSVRIVSRYLTEQCSLPARWVDAFDLGLLTDSNFTNAEIDHESYELIRKNIGSMRSGGDVRIPIVTGFLGKDRNGNITTLGRGGSDLTAAVLGAALGLTEIQVWKDVDGIMTTDPRLVPEALPVPELSFEEAAELAYFGANVLHPLSMIPAMKYNIPVRVKNSYDPLHPGTIIMRERTNRVGKGKGNLLTALTLKRNVTVVDIVSTRMLGQHGFLAEVFDVFRDLEISIDVVATSEVSLSLTVDQRNVKERLGDLIPRLEKFATAEVLPNKAIISLVGHVERASEMLRIVFDTFDNNGIAVQMMSQGASKVNISLCIDESEALHAATLLHRAFFNSERSSEMTPIGTVSANGAATTKATEVVGSS